jgi:hypothetical protein
MTTKKAKPAPRCKDTKDMFPPLSPMLTQAEKESVLAARCKDTVDMFNEGVPYQGSPSTSQAFSALMAANRVHSERITKLEEWNKAQEARITWYIDRLNNATEGMKTLSDRLDSCEADQHPVKSDRAPRQVERELSINESRTVELLDWIIRLVGPQGDVLWRESVLEEMQSEAAKLRTQIKEG